MTIMLGNDKLDPLDIHRRLIFDAAQRSADYADMVVRLIDMRDDDRAYAMWGALREQAAKLNEQFNQLGRARRAQPAAAASDHFARADTNSAAYTAYDTETGGDAAGSP